MMGWREQSHGRLFDSFDLDEAVPADHAVRNIASVPDLSWMYAELAPHYSRTGRPSIAPVLIIRMLIIGYAFAIRSERALCREVRVNLAYRWFCGLGVEDGIPDHPAAQRNAFAATISSAAPSNASWRGASLRDLSAARASRLMPA